MGAINYKNNDYFISIGFDLDNFESDISDANYWACDMYDVIQDKIKKYNFYYYDVKLYSGYYDGFYLDIRLTWIFLDNYKEKQEANKELTQIKNFLLWCINNCCCVSYSANWITTYKTPKETIKLLKQAIKKEREKIKKLKTDRQVAKMTKPERAAIGLYW